MEQSKPGSKIELAKRPPISSNDRLNKISREITLLSNMFQMQVEALSDDQSQGNNNPTNKIECHLYDVDFKPAVQEDNRPLRYKIFSVNKRGIENIIGKFYFSGKSLYSIRRFSNNVLRDIENLQGQSVNGVNYQLRLRHSKTINVDQDNASLQSSSAPNLQRSNIVTQTINVVAKGCIRDLGYLEIGRNSKFFKTGSMQEIAIKDRQGNTQSVLECYKGFAFGVIPTREKLFLLSDYASRILRQETALDFLRQENNSALWNDLIAGQSVITEYNNFKIYKIDRIDQTKTPRSTFLYKETNLQTSFQDYYEKVYKIRITNPNQPLLVHIRKYREPNTNELKTQEIYLIPELCKMTGMTDQQRSNYIAMKAVAEHTKLSPLQRLKASQNIAQLLSEQLQSSGLRVNYAQSSIKAIQLNSPQITFGGQRVITANNGNFDMRAPIVDRLDFKSWILYHHKNNQADAERFVSTMKKAAQTYGINVSDPQYVRINSYSSQNWIQEIDQDFDDKTVYQFAVTFGQINARLYQDLKKFLNVEVGIESQHVNPQSLKKNEMSVVSKIILQIASKLGNRIWSVQIPQGINPHTMIIGIETSMKKLQQQQCIGVVASINNDFTKYYSDVDIRQSSDTTLPTLSKIIQNAIAAYSKNNNKNLPQEVIVYRQGLGEGQIQQSMNLEIQAIQKGFKLFHKDYTPRFAFFQVNRKVGQKFYQETRNGSEPISNPNSGIIVAKEVVQNNFEFFMAAQNCNSGVCTPTKYTCLFNNTNLTEDMFWQFTYFQTFNYFNWQGPVRVPAAMKYAEKLAKFVSEVLQTSSHDFLTNSLFYL